jgi:uncharacterized membrane protein
MDMISALHVLPALPGVIFLIAGALMQKFPAKKRNMLYGYRTTSSMKSQESWDVAQAYGARESMRLGAIQAVVGLAVGYTVANEVFPVAYIIVSAVACGIALIARTEIEVRRMEKVREQAGAASQ